MTLAVTQLRKDYPTRSGPLSVLRGIDLRIEPGDALAILGPSGSGKSTLLQIVGTLDRPTSGSIRLGEQDLFELGDRALARFRNRHIGFIFQDHHLLPQCTVLENVLVPTLAEAGKRDPALEKRARELLARVGLAERLEHRPAELSGGERQRVAVARALIYTPELLLADEPTGNLDCKSSQAVGQLLVEMHRQENSMLIVVTHNADLARTLPKQMEMNDGTLAEWNPAGR
ncbi:MAG: ABC transporter ATP-binding protein [Planctomycetes bacterium]|nr:ABC transporter ATP-binding protein [Planctomycetota bacterium]